MCAHFKTILLLHQLSKEPGADIFPFCLTLLVPFSDRLSVGLVIFNF